MRAQFETETGEVANSALGAYVMQPFGDDLLLGVSNDPGNYNGALLTRSSDGSTFITETTFDEQGIHDMQVVGDRVFVPGTDSVWPVDEWSLGDVYERSALGAWTKRRTLPNTIHALGLWHDGSTIYVCGGMHTGDNATYVGRVLRSTDDGAAWDAQVDLTNYRVFDVIGHAGRLYAIGTTAEWPSYLYSSIDGGDTWDQIGGVEPDPVPRMITFGTSIIFAGVGVLYRVDADHVVPAHTLPFLVASWWNVLATDGANVYVLDSIGYVWRSINLVNWTRYTYVANAISIAWWDAHGLMIADAGMSARIWIA